METRVTFIITPTGDIFFECKDHSSDHDVCTIASTLCNVLLAECKRAKIEPVAIDDGYVKIVINKADVLLIEVFRAVRDMFYEVEDQHPYNIKVY